MASFTVTGITFSARRYFGAFPFIKLFGLETIFMLDLYGHADRAARKNAVLIVGFAVQKPVRVNLFLKASIEGALRAVQAHSYDLVRFHCRLIPLVAANGPGIRQETEPSVSAAAGGMFTRNSIRGFAHASLYYFFAKISEKHVIVEDRYENPLTEEIDNNELQ